MGENGCVLLNCHLDADLKELRWRLVSPDRLSDSRTRAGAVFPFSSDSGWRDWTPIGGCSRVQECLYSHTHGHTNMAKKVYPPPGLSEMMITSEGRSKQRKHIHYIHWLQLLRTYLAILVTLIWLSVFKLCSLFVQFLNSSFVLPCTFSAIVSSLK